MRLLPELFANNRIWAARSRRSDPQFFERLRDSQAPRFLWIGCADSRVPADSIVGLSPGELFVHRNVANVVSSGDLNLLSVLQYAVDVLGVDHVIVCGHSGCGGVRAALDAPTEAPFELWIHPIRALYRRHRAEIDALDDERRWRRLCELNVRAQVSNVADTHIVARAWARGQKLAVHGWIYSIHDGLLEDLDVTLDGPGPRLTDEPDRAGLSRTEPDEPPSR